MNKELELTAKNETNIALSPSPSEMMQAMIKSGVTAENAAAFTELVRLSEHMEDRAAQKEFAAAFVALQSEMPTIVAKTIIPNRGKYERYEDLMEVIGPLLSRHNFTVSFSMDFKDNRILETCHLRHNGHHGSHTQSNSFAVRAGRADSDTQSDCKAATTAKRNAFCNALNIVIRQDILNEEHDAGMEGDPNAKLSPQQAEELEHRVQMSNSNIAAFLKFAGATKFSEIRAAKYDELDAMLRRKENPKG